MPAAEVHDKRCAYAGHQEDQREDGGEGADHLDIGAEQQCVGRAVSSVFVGFAYERFDHAYACQVLLQDGVECRQLLLNEGEERSGAHDDESKDDHDRRDDRKHQ